jgi:hypothetical protein
MAAMRMKDRSGPGMLTVSTPGNSGGAAALADAGFGWSDALTALPEEQAHRQQKAETKMANVRGGHFIIGYLFEASSFAAAHNKVWNDPRPARDVLREPNLGL